MTTKRTGALIKSARRHKGMTQTDLGKIVGVSAATINKYEQGDVNLTRPRIEALSKALDISPIEFLKDDPNAPIIVVANDNSEKAFRKYKAHVSKDLGRVILSMDTSASMLANQDKASSLKRASVLSREARELLTIYKQLPVRKRVALLNYAYELLDKK